jgi:hypothetical protein
MKRALFVLLVTDRNVCLCTPAGEIITDETDWQPIAEALLADAHCPVRLVLDSVDQVYEQVSIKLRNPLDRHRLLARKRLALSPFTSTSGTLRLEKRHYLLTAGAGETGMKTALALLAQTGNPLHDITLFPLEAGRYLVRQFPALAQGWSIVTLDSALTGFRQLVLRQGKTVFGRLMLPARAGSGWQREIAAMLTYLPRLGLPRETPVALVANLEQAPLGSIDFPGAAVGDLFFLPADSSDFAAGFLHWHGRRSAGRKQAQLTVGRRYWQPDRFSKAALRAACCLTAIIALLGTAGIVHLHRQVISLSAETAAEAGRQVQLAAALAGDRAADGRENTLRLALALHEATAKPASELPRVKAALAALPSELGLNELAYQHAPFAVRASFATDPQPQVAALAKQLPGLSVKATENALLVTAP